VNINGAMNFSASISQFTPDPFPLNASENIVEIIAPYWADVDTTGTGEISYRQTTNEDLLQRADNDIKTAFSTIPFSSAYLFIATWDHVGFYSSQVNKVHNSSEYIFEYQFAILILCMHAINMVQTSYNLHACSVYMQKLHTCIMYLQIL